MARSLVILLICYWWCWPAWGQQNTEDALFEIQQAFEELKYEQVERLASEILDEYQLYSTTELAVVHVTLALVKFALNDHAEAQKQFRSALMLDPSMELDPVLVSPKIRTFFQEIKDTMAAEREVEDDPEVEVRYIFVEDVRPPAALRSMVLPGWGQLYKKEKAKGWAIIGLWGGAVAATTITHVLRDDASEAYRNAQDPGTISSRYDRFNRLHKTRNTLALVALGIWGVSYVDALASIPGKGAASPTSRSPVSIEPIGMYPEPGISMTWTF